MNWLILLSSLLILSIIIGAGLLPAWERFDAILRSGKSVGDPIFRLLILGAMAIVNLYAVFNMLFSSELIVLNQTTLEIQRWLFRMNLSQRSFPNSTVENLRYDEWSGGRAGMQNGIRFESAGETVTFARQITGSDSWDLIDKMCEIYKFPTKEESTETERSPAVTNW
ncbi:MAG: hypothetical protein ACLPH3_20945 [Terracidiphilus sp.]